MRKTCLNQVHELAKRDQRVVFIGSDLGAGTLDPFKTEFPERFFMEGIAEQNVIGMAAGMAMEGFIPHVNTIASFLTRRCLEQVAIDICLHELPVRLIGNGGGVVYAPLGPTHLATEDMALMRALPNMTVVTVADAEEMKRFMSTSLTWPGPIYIRLAKGGDPVVSRPGDGFTIGRAITLREGEDLLLIACGIMVHRALAVANRLADEGVSCTVLNVHTIKPLDDRAIRDRAMGKKWVVTLEEHSRIGGLGSAVADCLLEDGPTPLPGLLRLALPDRFPHLYGSQDAILAAAGLDVDGIVGRINRAMLSK